MKKALCFISIFVLMTVTPIVGLNGEESQSAPKGMGLAVEPGGMLVQYVPIGITYDFTKEVGIPLRIYNKDGQLHTYVLSVSKPSEVGTKKWVKGYLEMPDPAWIWFDKSEVTIEANATAKVNMFLAVPKAEKYYNQHWAVSLGIKGKPEAGQALALALHPRIEVETLSKKDVRERPDGVISTVPSVLLFKNISLGKKEKLALKIFNNDEKNHRYQITPAIFPSDSKTRQIVPSPTYSWIPDERWIKPAKRWMDVNAQEVKKLTVEVKIPKEKEYHRKNWEAILFIEPEEKGALSGFARIQIQTEPRRASNEKL